MKMEFSAGGLVYKKIPARNASSIADAGGDSKIEFALIVNHDQKWTFPKGHIEKGEKPEDAAKREVGEEIGVEDLTVEVLLEKIDYWFYFEKERIHKFVYFYLMEAPSDAKLNPQLDEVSDAQWFSPEKMTKVIHYKEDVKLIELAFEKLGIKN